MRASSLLRSTPVLATDARSSRASPSAPTAARTLGSSARRRRFNAAAVAVSVAIRALSASDPHPPRSASSSVATLADAIRSFSYSAMTRSHESRRSGVSDVGEDDDV
eukprot:30945-Pelagococcus_subviridis.AAC.3